MDDFRQTLSAIVDSLENSGKNLPIFFFIDELDRCRPTYAIELLETVKHIFGVEGIYFAIATDTEQLAASIKSVYGTEFSSSRYLKRFFHAEYTFPELENYDYATHLFSKLNLLDHERLLNPIPPINSGDYPPPYFPG
ncbi:KAP family P-loop NTPase fold protein [Cupriavidus basilensis]|uniref:KAP family P-loop NTPase fold protein n=1 Tax=Cupriavidus basilensis TaxID=68895 RepID=UPI003D33F413